MALGVVKGDIKKVAVNGGILGLAAPRMGNAVKIGA